MRAVEEVMAITRNTVLTSLVSQWRPDAVHPLQHVPHPCCELGSLLKNDSTGLRVQGDAILVGWQVAWTVRSAVPERLSRSTVRDDAVPVAADSEVWFAGGGYLERQLVIGQERLRVDPEVGSSMACRCEMTGLQWMSPLFEKMRITECGFHIAGSRPSYFFSLVSSLCFLSAPIKVNLLDIVFRFGDPMKNSPS